MTLITNIDTAHASTRLAGDSEYAHSAISIASFNRPSNTVPYASGDVMTDSDETAKAIEFPNCAKANGGSGVINKIILTFEQTVALNLNLWVFDEEPTNFLDNAALALVSADLPKVVGVFTYDDNDKVNAGTNIETYFRFENNSENGRHPYVCASDSTSLYGLLSPQTVFAPTSGAKIHIHLSLRID